MFTTIVLSIVFGVTSVIMAVTITHFAILPTISERYRHKKQVKEFLERSSFSMPKFLFIFAIWFACGHYLLG